ncbi:hypothetical protein ACMFMG_000128 [Clarireedia jacksonii]
MNVKKKIETLVIDTTPPPANSTRTNQTLPPRLLLRLLLLLILLIESHRDVQICNKKSFHPSTHTEQRFDDASDPNAEEANRQGWLEISAVRRRSDLRKGIEMQMCNNGIGI